MDRIEKNSCSMAPAAALDLIRPSIAVAPWLTVKQAAERVQCGIKTIYREAKSGRLRAARVGGRRDLRLRPEWVDAWLDSQSKRRGNGSDQKTA